MNGDSELMFMAKINRDKMSTYEQMMTSPPPPLLLGLAVPAVISKLIDSIYNFADTYFVSGLGTSATGAVGIAYPVMTVVYACGLLMGICNAVLAKSKKKEGAKA